MNSSSELQFYLASGSPRRKEILAGLGLNFDLLRPQVDETLLVNEHAEQYVVRLACAKAFAGEMLLTEKHKSLPVLGADTTVVCDNKVLGKPDDLNDAGAMLKQLSGKWHEVMSAVSVSYQGREENCLSITRVKFKELTDDEIRAYCLTGEPEDKAGSYAIQGLAATFIERIEGSYSGVVGLPIFETNLLLVKFGITINSLASAYP